MSFVGEAPNRAAHLLDPPRHRRARESAGPELSTKLACSRLLRSDIAGIA
jgi:hypothetical protein